jgi:hypothetical protein
VFARLRVPALFFLAVGLVLGLAACGGGASPSGAPSAPAAGRSATTRTTGTAPSATTAVDTFQAYTASGVLSVAVSGAATGSCFTGSIAAPGPDAYRCFAAGNTLLDPCFAPATTAKPTSVACVQTPWSQAVVLTLTAPLPADPPTPGLTRPWALRLHNGARCVAVTGTVPSAGSVNLAYQCTSGYDAALIDPKAPELIAYYGAPEPGPATSTAPAALARVPVDTVWRG